MNLKKLKGAMAEKDFTQSKLASMLGLSLKSFSAKINGKTEFKVNELAKISKILDVDPSIFFD